MVLTAADGIVFIRYSESALLGMMAYIFLTDMTIGKDQIARELRLEFGLPKWTVPIIGVIQAAVAVGNFHDGGQWQFVAQKILATLMGGCVFAHVVQAGKTKNAMAPVVLLIFSVLLPILAETEPWEVVVPVHIALAAFGYTAGEALKQAGLIDPVPVRRVMDAEATENRRASSTQAAVKGGGAAQAAFLAELMAQDMGDTNAKTKED